ncbi:MAG: patatin-like phospholipase family protein [Methylotetracoccus sp.]|nr:patatin-like phospholipase family protein [Methylotetracoccus sp.]
MNAKGRSRVAIACQGGGSHTAFTAGVLHELIDQLPDQVDIVAVSGTSGGAICATLAWDGLLRNEPERAKRQLQRFWEVVAANEPWDMLANLTLQNLVNLRNHMVLPEVSPYVFPPWGQDRLRDILNQQLDFEELQRLAERPDAPALHIGAVEVLSGHFEVFTGPELQVECLLASTAVPDLFPAVTIPGRGVYWDGLFSQNPPIHDLTDHNINELWVIQINPSSCGSVPTETHEIIDRRNELAGNISLEQELRIIAMMNRLLASGQIMAPKYHPIHVARIVLERELDYASKLDRTPAFLAELMEYGRAKARVFLNERQGMLHTLKARGVIAAEPAAITD